MIHKSDIERITATKDFILVLDGLSKLMKDDLNEEGGLTKAKWKEVQKTMKYARRAAFINRLFHFVK